LEKRSLSIAGHRTSLALEPEFWAVLEAMAADRKQSVAALVRAIDETRTGANLSSAVRVAALEWVRHRPYRHVLGQLRSSCCPVLGLCRRC
jgi:predicted DNA-binding ribbon-helix-helix protein